jgi:hypothetical protein
MLMSFIDSSLMLRPPFHRVWTTPLPPRPFTPAGVKGSLNSRFDCVAPNTELRARGCGARLLAKSGERGGRSERQHHGSASGCVKHPSASAATRDTTSAACKVSSANEHADFGCLTAPQLERAEQRSGGRIRAGACLRRKPSLRPTPTNASSARNPEGARSAARLSFAYFSLAKQRKVRRLPGRNPACNERQSPRPPGRDPACPATKHSTKIPSKARPTTCFK